MHVSSIDPLTIDLMIINEPRGLGMDADSTPLRLLPSPCRVLPRS